MVVTSCINVGGLSFKINLTDFNNEICLSLENENSFKNWQSFYSKNDIEELTKKTGSFKRFSTFVAMLKAALKQTNHSVNLDILTSFDLNKLRKKRFGLKSLEFNSKDDSKMYLVLTHCDDFGSRVHYPLSLLPSVKDATPSPNSSHFEHNPAKYQKSPNPWMQEFKNLKKEVVKLKREKLEVKSAFAAYKEEMEAQRLEQTNEIARLERVVVKLKKEIGLSCNQHVKESKEKSQETRNLKAETERLKRGERELKMKVQKLLTELSHFRRSRSEQRNSRDSSFERKTYHLQPHSPPGRISRLNYLRYNTRQAPPYPPRPRKSYSLPPASHHSPPFHAYRPSRSPARPMSTLLARLTRPTSSSSLKQVSRHVSPSFVPRNMPRNTTSNLRYDPPTHHTPTHLKVHATKVRSDRSSQVSPSSTASSFASSTYKPARLLKKTSKSKSYQRKDSKYDYNEFGSLNNAEELAEIDVRLAKLKMFMNENL